MVSSPTAGRDESLASLRHAAEHQPLNPLAWSRLGSAYARSWRSAAAVSSFEKAVALAPADARLYAQLADAHRLAGNMAEAVKHFEKAVHLAPGLLPLRVGLGNAYRMSGDLEAGIATLETAIREFGDSSLLQVLIGDLKMALGLFPAAAAHYWAALALDEGDVNALIGLSRLEEDVSQDDLVSRIVARLADANIQEDARIALLFAHAALLDRAGQYEAAFARYREANACMRRRAPFNPKAQAAAFDAVARAFTASALNTARDWGADSEKPIFIIGMPRSGTTLVERILGAHPLVRALGELPYILRLIQDWPDLIGGDRRYPHDIGKLAPEDLEALGRRYLDKVHSLARDAARVVDKNPFNFEHLGLISMILPRARIVHCVRDAMDVCASNFTKLYQGKQAAFSYDLDDLAEYYKGYRKLMGHWRAVRPHSILDLSYETLVENPETEIRRLLAFCGLPWDDRCLESEDHLGAVLTASAIQVRRPVTSAAVGKWKRFEAALAPLERALRDD